MDATSTLPKRIQDEKEWDAVIRGVPNFRPHVKLTRTVAAKNEKGEQYNRQEQTTVEFETNPPDLSQYFKDGWSVAFMVTPADLEDIAAVAQNKIDSTADFPAIRIGHIDLKRLNDQKAQPEIVGYQANPRYGLWGPTQIPGVLTDYFIEKGQLGKIAELPDPAKGMNKPVMKYPNRSLEYYPRTKEFTGTALLNTDAELNLGMVTFSRDRGPCYQYAMQGWGEGPASSPPPQAGQGGPTGQPNALAPTPEEYAKHEACQQQYEAKNYPKLRQMHDSFGQQPQQPQQPGQPGQQPAPPATQTPPMTQHGSMGVAGPMTNMPQQRQYGRETVTPEAEAALKLQMDSLQKSIEELRAENKSLKEFNHTSEQTRVQQYSANLLDRMTTDGYLREANKDSLEWHLKELVKLPTDPERDALVGIWRVNYQRREDPVQFGNSFPIAAIAGRVADRPVNEITVENHARFFSQDDYRQVEQYQRDHEKDPKYLTDGTSDGLYTDAVKSVLDKKKQRGAA